ncbi:MBL fold metallo-hydrolase [Halomarina oriensis]|uniref:MBL fold metallo-hydrolase n=1 Tax=Halomarina oriensis TaxID=671145 RepID=A0A6B0GST3_9EURY|nr:MBL fold metallo-hydrolase [Halomarina oriensis]MWG36769.1 MBL fold metallo-hydrolase [Halomarina oriensis]
MTDTDVVERVDGIYDITCVERENGRIRAFLVDADRPTLFDAGLPDTTDELLAGIEEAAVVPDQVVVTHADGDHVGGVDAVCAAHDCALYLPEGSDPDVESDHEFYGEDDSFAGFEAVHAPGHRAHQHLFVNEDRGVAVMADAASGADQRGLPKGHFHLPPGIYSEDLVLAEESLAKLREYEFDVGLVYHGSSVLEDAAEKLRAYVALVE